MSYRRKKLLALFFAMALSMTAVAGCTGAKSSTGNVVSSETETNAEETSAQSEAGTFSSADMFTERDLAGTYEESGAVYVTLSDDGITGETDGDDHGRRDLYFFRNTVGRTDCGGCR